VATAELADRTDFNTKKVRLKPAGLRPNSPRRIAYFNTKKVRLKPVVLEGGREVTKTFQYQKGAIKTGAGRSTRPRFQKISIPKRCD